MEVDNVANVVAEMVGDMEVDRVADELTKRPARVSRRCYSDVNCMFARTSRALLGVPEV